MKRAANIKNELGVLENKFKVIAVTGSVPS